MTLYWVITLIAIFCFDIARDLLCISGNFSLTTPTVSRLAGVYQNGAMRLLFRMKLLHIGLRPVSTPTSAACGAAAKPVRLRGGPFSTLGFFLCQCLCARLSDEASLESESSPYWPVGSFNPNKCCMWGGSKAGACAPVRGRRVFSCVICLYARLRSSVMWAAAGAPLERLGTCSQASGGFISLRNTVSNNDIRFIATLPTLLSEKITSIPVDAFDNCGTPL